MSKHPIQFVVPQTCAICGPLNRRISLQHTLQANQVTLQWHCDNCDTEWPVTVEEGQAVPFVVTESSSSQPLCPFCKAPASEPEHRDHGVDRYQCTSCGKFWAVVP